MSAGVFLYFCFSSKNTCVCWCAYFCFSSKNTCVLPVGCCIFAFQAKMLAFAVFCYQQMIVACSLPACRWLLVACCLCFCFFKQKYLCPACWLLHFCFPSKNACLRGLLLPANDRCLFFACLSLAACCLLPVFLLFQAKMLVSCCIFACLRGLLLPANDRCLFFV